MFKWLFEKPIIQWPAKFAQKRELANDDRLVAFYSTELPAPETPISEIEFVAMDFETTGLNPEKHDIITIGLVPFNLRRVFLRDSRHWKVRPKKQLKEDSVIIHGITHSDLIDAPDLSDILEELLPCLSGKIVVVHYRRIEREFLNNALKSRIGEGIEFPVVDTLKLEETIQHTRARNLWEKIKGKKPESVRLAQSRRRYGLPDYTPHHALTDAIATAELLQAQIAHHYDDSDPISHFWL
ncbi:3'-5' exonuclease [Vibrio mytili]|uniref:DNA-directed DNA polymerase n=1 Tax=Vibrio mytili TaxID=50718 RepID=A0A0C3HS37_9VIBR|nr:3'-5' exonuclease [Vibrio mytili]KIN11006.1 DNA polymerase III subunit epsilon [Vibrio mytili]